jgi:hypothetical protein
MKTSAERSENNLRGLAGLFDDAERKEIFRKYLIFLGYIEILIFVVCWLYQLGSEGYDRYGPIDVPFPWRAYFMVAFLAPIAITFLVGIVVVGFNKYFTDAAPQNPDSDSRAVGKSTGFYKLQSIIHGLQHVPFLGLLLLLGLALAVFYRLDSLLGFFATVGEQSIRVLLMAAVVVLGIVSIFGLVLILINYRLRKASMEYQYKSEVAERYGLIILDDNTVLNKDGELLVRGKKFKGSVQLLPDTSPPKSDKESESAHRSSHGNVPAPANAKGS